MILASARSGSRRRQRPLVFSAPSGLDVLDPSGFGQIGWRPVAPRPRTRGRAVSTNKPRRLVHRQGKTLWGNAHHRFAHHLGSARSPQRMRVREAALIADLLAGCQDPQHVFARKSLRDARGVRQLGSGSRRRRVRLVRRRPRCQGRRARWSCGPSREVACSGRSCICWAGIGSHRRQLERLPLDHAASR